MATETVDTTKVKTGEVRFSYLHGHTPKQVAGKGPEKYSVSLIIDKNDAVTIKAVKSGIDAAIVIGKAKFGKAWKPDAKEFDNPLRDGDDAKKEDDEAYNGSWYLSAKSDTKPGIIDRSGKELSENEIKSGDHGKVMINFFPFNTAGNQGVGVGLNNILKTKNGDALAGRADAKYDFADDLGEADGSLLGGAADDDDDDL